MAVGNHTMTHPCLARCSDDKAAEEAERAHRQLGEAIGHPPRSFAYPNGDWDERVERLLAEGGYEVAFLFDHRHNPAVPRHPCGSRGSG